MRKSCSFLGLFILCLLLACCMVRCHSTVKESQVQEQIESTSKAKKVIEALHDPNSQYVVVVSHRGDWRNYPENSIPTIIAS